MERGVWVFRNGELIPKHLAPPLHRKFAQSAYVISDTLDGVMNMADGKRYDSKAKYYKAVRNAGCEIVGNERIKPAPPKELPPVEQSIKEAIEIVEARRPTQRRKGRRHV